MTTPSASQSGAFAAPPPWSLMTPDARQPGQISDAARAAQEAKAAKSATAAGPQPRADDKPEIVRYEGMFGEDGFTFADALDAINPLQHLPVVSTVYRELTGDQIDPGARLAGGALFGGVVGLFGAVADTISQETSGKDLGQHAMAFLFGDGAPVEDAGTATAQAEPQPAESVQTAQTARTAQTASADAAPEAAYPARAAAAEPQGQPAKPQQAQLASLQPTAFFRSLQQPKSHELPPDAAQSASSAQQAALQAGKIQARTGTGVPQGVARVGSDGAGAGIRPTGFIQPGARAAEAAGPRPQSSQPPAPTPSQPTAGARPTAAGSGPAQLSPAAANVLMRMAEQSAGGASPTANPQPTPQRQASQPPAAAPAPGPSAAAPDLEQVPEAMMAALQKYEALKRGE